MNRHNINTIHLWKMAKISLFLQTNFDTQSRYPQHIYFKCIYLIAHSTLYVWTLALPELYNLKLHLYPGNTKQHILVSIWCRPKCSLTKYYHVIFIQVHIDKLIKHNKTCNQETHKYDTTSSRVSKWGNHDLV